jgi:hypothetical protein
MRIGVSLFLIAVGAVLRYAITIRESHGINIWNVGVILMIVGIVGLFVTAIFMLTRRRTDVIHSDAMGPAARTTYMTPHDAPF